jgi:hypothetical protein
MSKYVTEAFLRTRLTKELNGKTQGQLAGEAKVSRQLVSMSLSGRYPFSPQLARHLGYRKVEQSLFVREQ